MEKQIIVTMPPYAPYLTNILRNNLVRGIRLNTVMPVKGDLSDLLARLQKNCEKYKKEFWVDLKGKQLRIKSLAQAPYTSIELNHEVNVFTPCKAYFNQRYESATILEVDENKLIMQDGPKRVLTPGESVTIAHPSLEIKGGLTELDRKYIEFSKNHFMHNYMLSFVESGKDIEEILSIDKDANIILKIESQKGLNFVNSLNVNEYKLMAARGDLYMELNWPHKITKALELILSKDKNAIVASRIFDSMSDWIEPSSADIGDFDNLLRIGYKNFMLGDELCLQKESILRVLGIMEMMYNER